MELNEVHDVREVTLENEEGQGWKVRWKSGRMTRDPVLRDGIKVAEKKSHERRLYTVRLLFLFSVSVYRSKKGKRRENLSRSQFICERRFRGPLRRVSGLPAA